MRFTTVGDVRLAAPAGFDIDRWTMERVPGESDAEFEAAKVAYRKLFLGGGRIALPVSALTPHEIELIRKATPVPPEPDAS